MATLKTYWTASAPTPAAFTLNAVGERGAQQFAVITAPGWILQSVEMPFRRYGAAITVLVDVYAMVTNAPSGTSLGQGTFNTSSCSTTAISYISVDLGNVTLTEGGRYGVQVRSPEFTAANYVMTQTVASSATSTANLWPGGRVFSSTSGSVWFYTGAAINFKAYGVDGLDYGISPLDKNSTKYICSLGGNTFNYGKSAASMTELSSIGVDCTKPLTMTGAYQKCFIAGNTALQVVDFGTVQLDTPDVGASAIPPRTTILTGSPSGAQMTVDFIAGNSATQVYGYLVGGTFTTADTVTDSTGALSVSFTVDSVSTGPHSYDWTPYANDTATYGTMPNKAQLVARYRGRLVLAGNPEAPYQWYMSKVNAPFDWFYSSVDPLSAIAGHNADAGEIGETVHALIPYGDDWLVFGCSDSMHLLTGDPAQGGSIDDLSDEIGIFGPHAWCKDSEGTLYFYGTGGVYQMDGGRSKPKNISAGVLPNIVNDFNPVISSDRVVLSYDQERNGLILTKTQLTAGGNDGYFIDLTTGGWFPESYPNDCGIFATQYFKSVDSAAVVYGGRDGYLYQFDNNAKDDLAAFTSTYSTITSYVGWTQALSESAFDEGKITRMVIDAAGGNASGSFPDSDSFTFSIYTGDDAETVMEDMIDQSGAFLTVGMVSAGRQPIIREHIRGIHAGFEIRNNTSGESWAVNKIFGDINPAGGKS